MQEGRASKTNVKMGKKREMGRRYRGGGRVSQRGDVVVIEGGKDGNKRRMKKRLSINQGSGKVEGRR